jgi:hypothetical protein
VPHADRAGRQREQEALLDTVRVEVNDGQVRVNSPVPVRFVSLSGETSSAAAGHSEFTL